MDLKRALQTDVGVRLRPMLAIFSAVHLATGEFVRNSFPSLNLIAVPAGVIAKLILLVQVLPFLVLSGVDVFISRRYSPATLRRYRLLVFCGSAVFILRQMELHFSYTSNFAANAQALSGIVYAGTALAAVGLVIWLVVRFYSPVTTFLAYFSPAALALTLIMTQLTSPQNVYYRNYDFAEVESHAPDGPPVYVIIFDELSYDALLNSRGEIDAELYPSFARLGRDSLHLTNATSNYYRTWLAVPEIIDSIVLLSDRYEVRIYEQTHRIESLYAPGCGTEYTCRGLRYMMQRSDIDLIAYLAMRATYDAAPDWMEKIARPAFHAVVRQIGSPPPPSDPLGFHEASTALLDLYLADISSLDANGRLYLLHTMLPHYPFVFDDHGEFEMDEHVLFPRVPVQTLTEAEYDEVWQRYRDQIAYADRFLGQVIERLEKEGLYDDAVIIVTSDHGLRPSSPIWGEPIEIDSLPTRVPMFIRAPGIQPKVSDIDYQHVDIGPTLFDLLGYDFVPPAVDGYVTQARPLSALDPERPEREKEFFVDFYDIRYWRYVYDPTSATWELNRTVESAIGDRTPLSGR